MLLFSTPAWIYNIKDFFFLPGTTAVLFVQIIVYYCLLTFIYWLLKKIISNKYQRQKWMTIIISVCVTLFLLEIVCQFAGVKSSYEEKRNGRRNMNINYTPTDFNIYPPYSLHTMKRDEYAYTRQTNGEGLSDKDWSLTTDKYRILALGDSFTEGDGTPADSTWVALIQKSFEADGIHAEWMNAGMCGSDPYYEYQLYQEKLAKYHPDMIIVATQDQDYAGDVLLRGGKERWNKKGIQGVSLLELFYAYSRLSRLFIENVLGYNELLVRGNKKTINRLKEKYIPEVINLYSTIAEQDDIPVVFIYFPSKYGIIMGYHQFFLGESFADSVMHKKDVYFYDLLPCYKEYIKASGHSYDYFWWEIDGHHNSKGYEMMAHCIYENIRQELINANANEQSPN